MQVFILILAIITSVHEIQADTPVKKVEAKKWLKVVSRDSVNDLCRSKSYFPSCYSTGSTTCKMAMKKYFKSCSKGRVTSKYFYPEKSGLKLIANVASCAGKKFHKKFVKQFKQNNQCRYKN